MSIDWVERARAMKLQVRNFVNGRYVDGGGEPLSKYSSRDGQLLCRFGAGVAQDVDEAVAVARRAFEDGRWSKLPAQRRKDALYKLISLMEQHREELALLESLDVGKPISDAFNLDVTMAIGTLKYTAEAADKFFGKVYSVGASNLSYQLRRPRGVVGGIIGWNFPLVLAAAKIGPVLATGNTLVLNPQSSHRFRQPVWRSSRSRRACPRACSMWSMVPAPWVRRLPNIAMSILSLSPAARPRAKSCSSRPASPT